MKKVALIFAVLILASGSLRAQDGHEYAPILEKTVNYKNWTLGDLANNKPTSLRSLMQGKKLVMVLYFAPWCPNWRNERRSLSGFTRNIKRRVLKSSVLVNTHRVMICEHTLDQPARPIGGGGIRVARRSRQNCAFRISAIDW